MIAKRQNAISPPDSRAAASLAANAMSAKHTDDAAIMRSGAVVAGTRGSCRKSFPPPKDPQPLTPLPPALTPTRERGTENSPEGAPACSLGREPQEKGQPTIPSPEGATADRRRSRTHLPDPTSRAAAPPRVETRG